MNVPFAIQTLHERRKGHDLIAKAYKQETRFGRAVPRYREARGNNCDQVSGITW